LQDSFESHLLTIGFGQVFGFKIAQFVGVILGLQMQHWTGLLVKGKASLQLKIQHLRYASLPIIELIEMFFHVKDFDARVGILTMGIAVVFLWQGQLPQL